MKRQEFLPILMNEGVILSVSKVYCTGVVYCTCSGQRSSDLRVVLTCLPSLLQMYDSTLIILFLSIIRFLSLYDSTSSMEGILGREFSHAQIKLRLIEITSKPVPMNS